MATCGRRWYDVVALIRSGPVWARRIDGEKDFGVEIRWFQNRWCAPFPTWSMAATIRLSYPDSSQQFHQSCALKRKSITESRPKSTFRWANNVARSCKYRSWRMNIKLRFRASVSASADVLAFFFLCLEICEELEQRTTKLFVGLERNEIHSIVLSVLY